jgi:OOP family OmpA-OmpF porin
VVKNIHFDFNKATLTADAKTSLDTSIFKLMNENPEIIIEIGAHTDSKGDDKYNMNLSQKRAESVVNHLASKGIAAKRIIAKGYGETKPIAPNQNPDGSDNPEGRDKNRRTEFKVIGKIDVDIIYEDN